MIVAGSTFFMREKWRVGLKIRRITIEKKRNLNIPRKYLRLLLIGGFVIL